MNNIYVRQVYINVALQCLNRVHAFVSSGIVYDRYFKTVILCHLNGLYYGRREVGSRNKINVMDAGGLSFQHYFRKSPDAYFLAEIIGADVVILTEYASKGTSEKNIVPDPLVPLMGGSSQLWTEARAALTSEVILQYPI